LFYVGFSLDERVGADNRYRRIDEVLDLDFVRPAVAHRYGEVGNPSIDPIVALKLMLICRLEGVGGERELMRRLPERLDWLWFCQYDLDSVLPDHSVLTKCRQRWGVDLFASLFVRVLMQCTEAGLVDGETVHLDSSLIQGDVSAESLRPAFAVLARETFEQLEKTCETPMEASPVPSAPIEAHTKLSVTDPDARCRRKGAQRVTGYAEHRTVDDRYGIITASETTDASVDDAATLETMVEQHESNTGGMPTHVVADRAYGTASNYMYLRDRGVLPCIPHQKPGPKKGMFAHACFAYDVSDDCYLCPNGQRLHRDRTDHPRRRFRYRAAKGVCAACSLQAQCTSSVRGRAVYRHMDQEAVDWADGCLSRSRRRHLQGRRRSVIEGSFGDATTQHGLKRSPWRRQWRVKIRNLLIATIQNLRKLLKYGSDRRRRGLAASLACVGPSATGWEALGRLSGLREINLVRI
jgi:transposase